MKSLDSALIYKSIFENIIDGLAYCQMIFDKEGRPVDFKYIKVNKSFEVLTGLKNAIGKNVSELIPGISESNPELFEIYGNVSLTGNTKRFETYIPSLSRWFMITAYSPKKHFFVAIFQNISDQKQKEREWEDERIAARNVLEDLGIEKSKIEAARAKEEAILLSIGDGLIATDEKGKIILINDSAERLLRNKGEEVIGKVFSDVILVLDEKGALIPVEKRPMNLALSYGIITATTTSGPTYYYLRKDKTKFLVAVTVTPVILNGKIIGTIEVFRDITREKDIDRAKTEFISLASHQLRTPLTTISWYTEMILGGDVGKVIPEQKKYLEAIYQGDKQMIELVNTLLDVSRLELGVFEVHSKPTDIIEIAKSALLEQKLKIEKKKLIVTENFARDIETFLTDPRLLRIVFENLLSNAVNYTGSGGRIEFSISIKDSLQTEVSEGEGRTARELSLAYRPQDENPRGKQSQKTMLAKISDTGLGIPKNQQNQIFTKLFRADNVRMNEEKGTGFGLYIVKSIVENFGGKIWFESEENKGSTFFVSIPFRLAGKSEKG